MSWKQCLKKFEDNARGLSEFKGVMGWEAGRTTLNVFDCILSLDIQKVPVV